jgi:hypothetical protein
MSNLDTPRDLGDGLATLYTAVNGRVGHEDPTELLTEIADELERLSDMTSSRLRPPANTARGAACGKDGLGTFGAVTTDIAAMEHAASVGDGIAKSLLYMANYLEHVGYDPATLVVWLLEGVLSWACDCLCWGVTR